MARALDQLRPTMTVIVIFYQGYVAQLAPLEYQELLLTREEAARRKILAKTRRLRRGLAHQLDHARSPFIADPTVNGRPHNQPKAVLSSAVQNVLLSHLSRCGSA
jgi:hypothetical protein